ncbi:erythromycin esterase family protein [Gemmatimonadota bacterium]
MTPVASPRRGVPSTHFAHAVLPSGHLLALVLILGSYLLHPPAAAAQRDLNLDFEETSAIRPGMLKYWSVIGPAGSLLQDRSVSYSGDHSLRIQRSSSDGFVSTMLSFPLHVARGHTIRYSGMIRTEGVEEGYAGLLWRVDGPAQGPLAFDNMADRGVIGTIPWGRHTIELEVPETAEGIFFGVLFTGRGTAWFDDLAIEIDGRPYAEVASLGIERPDPEDITWLRERAHPFISPDAGQGLADLAPFGEMVGDARIVALGEGTHGTSEFFRMKHRLLEYLANEAGFTVFAIEANMPEAMRVNDYVLTGEGDPGRALAGMYFWTWNTREVLDMIEWMRGYNASGRGRIEFWGFDMQYPNVALQNVLEFVREADPTYLPDLEKEYGLISSYEEEERRLRAGGAAQAQVVDHQNRHQSDRLDPARRVLHYLEDHRNGYLASRPTEEVEWAIQNARIVLQAADRGPASRDRYMAQNVGWILDHHPPGTKMVLWAHNGHVSRQPERMGGHLAREYGDDLVVAGFAFGEGEYRAVGAGGLGNHAAMAPPIGSYEHCFRAAGIPRLILDLREVTGEDWLATPREFRSIGSMALDYGFAVMPLVEMFDVLIYFDQTSAATAAPPP